MKRSFVLIVIAVVVLFSISCAIGELFMAPEPTATSTPLPTATMIKPSATLQPTAKPTATKTVIVPTPTLVKQVATATRLISATPTKVTAVKTFSIEVVNKTRWDVCHVFFTDPKADSWGKSYLDETEYIYAGESSKFDLPAGTYDFRVENCDYLVLNEQFGIVMDGNKTWTIGGPEVLLEDEFEDPKTGWTVMKNATGSVGYRDDTYFGISAEKGTAVIGMAGKSFTDLKLVAETNLVDAPVSGESAVYGVMCRVQKTGDGYAFFISDDAKYAIVKVQNKKFTPLVDWTDSIEINASYDYNMIEARCVGTKLALRVNGVTISTADDATFKTGDIGLITLTMDDQPTEVEFTYVVVVKP